MSRPKKKKRTHMVRGINPEPEKPVEQASSNNGSPTTEIRKLKARLLS